MFTSAGSFKKYMDLKNQAPGDNKMGFSARMPKEGSQVDRFMHEVDIMKEDVKTIEQLRNRLNETNEESRTIPDSIHMKQIRSMMDSDMDHVLILAKSIKKRIESLQFMSCANTIDRSRISVLMGLGRKVRDLMDEFQGLRVKTATVYKETIEYKYYTIAGERQYIQTIENLASSGQIEDNLEEAIQERGKDSVLDFLQEIQERREGSESIQRNLVELHQTFLDVAALVEVHGQKATNSGGGGGEKQQQVVRGNSFVKPAGAAHLLDHPEDYDMEAKRRAKIAIIGAASLVIMILVPLFVNESFKDLE